MMRSYQRLVEVWRDGHGAAWMLWLAARVGVDPKAVFLAKCDCARMALAYVPPDQHQPRLTIETVEAWQRGEATIDQVASACVACNPLRPLWNAGPDWNLKRLNAFVNAVSAAACAADCAGCCETDPASFAESAMRTILAVGAAAAAVRDDLGAGLAVTGKCADLVRARITVEAAREALDSMLEQSSSKDCAGGFVYELRLTIGSAQLLGAVTDYVAEAGFASERLGQ